MDEQKREQLIKNMTKNLPILRKTIGMNQDEFCKLIGVSRSTLATIETHKRAMNWNMFLSLILVFTKNKETDRLLNAMEIYTDEFNDYIKHAAEDKEESL